VAALEREAAAEHESLPLFPEDAAAPEPPADDSWRVVPFTLLNLPQAIVEKLYEAELATVGQLADWTAAGRELTDIPGIGPAKAEKIEEAMEAFWSVRTDSAESAAAEAAPTADAGDGPAGD
jgi:ERCC4-type nuclease